MADDLGTVAELGEAAAVEVAASALAARGAGIARCRNCDAPVFGAYCSVCGQEQETHRHTLRYLLHHFLAEIGSFDSRVFRTAAALLFQPGELPRSFREGRTQRYMPAVRLYLFVSLVFFLTLSVAGIALVQIGLREVSDAYTVKVLPNGATAVTSGEHAGGPLAAFVGREVGDRDLSPGGHSGVVPEVHFFSPIGQVHPEITRADRARFAPARPGARADRMNASYVAMGLHKLAPDPAALNAPLTAWMPRVLFIMLPLFALLLAIFYFPQRRQFYVVDHLVFSLSVHSYFFVVLIVAIGAAQIVPAGVLAVVVPAAIGIYLLFALKRFYSQGWVPTAVKFAAISFIYTVCFLGPAVLFLLFQGITAD